MDSLLLKLTMLMLVCAQTVFGLAHEAVLENGMRVIMESTDIAESDDEIFIQLTAKGGYALLAPDDQPSGRFATDILWEVGFGDLTSEQFSAALYESSSELQSSIQPLHRKIEASSWSEGVPKLVELITYLFKDPTTNMERLLEGLKKVRHKVANQRKIFDTNFEVESHLLNTDNWPPFAPLSWKQLESIRLEAARSFYKKSFYNPADFVCVVTGNFDKKTMLDLLKKSLGKIPTQKADPFSSPPSFPSFPSKMELKTVTQKERRESLYRFTFPIKKKVDEENVEDLKLLSNILEIHLRNTVIDKMKESHGMNVSYEFPYFPYLNDPWVIIQFHSHSSKAEMLSGLILDSLKMSVSEGVSHETILKAWRQSRKNTDLWTKDPQALLIELSNVALLGWDLKTVQKLHQPRKLSVREANLIIKDFIDPFIYTRIIAQP